MATQVIEFNATSGLTISCKLFAVGTDVIVDTATAVEKTNHEGRYEASYTDLPEGIYLMTGFVNGIAGFANEKYVILVSSQRYYPYPEINVPVYAVIPATATTIDRVNGTTVSVFTGEIGDVSMSVTDLDGNPVDLTGMTLQLVIEDRITGDIIVIDQADITVSGSTFTFALDATVTDSERLWNWSLKNVDDLMVQAKGLIEVVYAATEDPAP